MLDLFLKCLLFTFDTYQILTYILVICMMANPPYQTKNTMKAGDYLGYLYIKPVVPGTLTHTCTHARARIHIHTHTHTHTQHLLLVQSHAVQLQEACLNNNTGQATFFYISCIGGKVIFCSQLHFVFIFSSITTELQQQNGVQF